LKIELWFFIYLKDWKIKMDIKEAKKIYKEIPDHQLVALYPPESVFLDGDFTIEQLEAIICILKKNSLHFEKNVYKQGE